MKTIPIESTNELCWTELPNSVEPATALRQLAHLPNCLLFESALKMKNLGRYSFLMADPVQWIEIPCSDLRASRDLFTPLESIVQGFRFQNVPVLPPFQGGIAGLISYDAHRFLESIPCPAHDEFNTPAIAFGVYDVVVAFDHEQSKTFLISCGVPAATESQRTKNARERLELFWERLHQNARGPIADQRNNNRIQPAVHHALPQNSELASSFSESAYLEAVKAAIEFVHAGDVFQVNIAQRLLRQQQFSSLQLYESVRRRNAAPFSAFFDLGDSQVISASPERFFSVVDGFVETRPIKGTRRRTRYPEVDLDMAVQLQTSVKDRAENIMIVDLMRNDLSRVCKDHSIQVRDLCKVEAYESVLHLVSSVTGELRSDQGVFDLLRSAFPGGSITGAPKIRAMEIISELEPVARGAYCGSLGYVGFNGMADFNILIRTITAAGGWWQIPVGGGIVADSDPKSEYEETWTKAASLLHATQR